MRVKGKEGRKEEGGREGEREGGSKRRKEVEKAVMRVRGSQIY